MTAADDVAGTSHRAAARNRADSKRLMILPHKNTPWPAATPTSYHFSWLLRADSMASLVSIAMNTRSARAATYSAHHRPATRFKAVPARVAAARYAQVMVSDMSARRAELPMARLARCFRQANKGITTTAAAATPDRKASCRERV